MTSPTSPTRKRADLADEAVCAREGRVELRPDANQPGTGHAEFQVGAPTGKLPRPEASSSIRPWNRNDRGGSTSPALSLCQGGLARGGPRRGRRCPGRVRARLLQPTRKLKANTANPSFGSPLFHPFSGINLLTPFMYHIILGLRRLKNTESVAFPICVDCLGLGGAGRRAHPPGTAYWSALFSASSERTTDLIGRHFTCSAAARWFWSGLHVTWGGG